MGDLQGPYDVLSEEAKTSTSLVTKTQADGIISCLQQCMHDCDIPSEVWSDCGNIALTHILEKHSPDKVLELYEWAVAIKLIRIISLFYKRYNTLLANKECEPALHMQN